MLHLFYGEDDFTSREAASTVRAAHVDPMVGDLGFRLLDGTACAWEEVVQACSTLPFLAREQVVEVRGLLGAAAGERRGGAARRAETAGMRLPPPARVIAYLAEMPPSTVLILVEGAVAAANPYLKALQEATLPQTTVCYHPLMTPPAVARWLQERAQALDMTLDAAARELLQTIHKADLWAFQSELAKLSTYVGPGGAVTRQVVESLVPAAAEATVFALADAIGQRRLGVALALLHTLLDGGAAPEYIMAVLSGRVRDWLLGTGRGPRPAGLTQAGLVDAFAALLNADRVLKTGSADDRLVVMDLLVTVLAERLPCSLLEEAFA